MVPLGEHTEKVAARGVDPSLKYLPVRRRITNVDGVSLNSVEAGIRYSALREQGGVG